jgi:transcriptional regulator with XRE-family HTH domain
MAVLRRLIGEALRRERLAQQRTLREVSGAARVSLGYLSEVERGQKEASSELLTAICEALEVPLSRVLREVSGELALAELSELGALPAVAAVPVGAIGRPAVAAARPSLVVNRAA